jgi:tetratricopeptide (TPR) repeat protein
MHLTISSVIVVVLTLMWCSIGVAQAPATSPSWETCQQAPTRTCLLDEALTRALSISPSTPRGFRLGSIAQAQAAAGNIEKALQILESIPPDHASRLGVLRAVASAQARLGPTTVARETFSNARQLADSLDDQLSRAEALKSIAEAQAEAMMMAEAADTFEETLAVAKAVEIQARSPCIVVPAPEARLEGLFKTLAERQAGTGDISNSLQTARLIKYHPHLRAGVLRMIAETQAQRGQKVEAGLILKEAVEAAHASQTPPERWPSCPNGGRHLAASPELYAEALLDVAKVQARATLMEDAVATLEAALQLVLRIKDGSLLKADASRALVLTKIAEAQNETGLGDSGLTFDRAVQAASEVQEARWRVMVLARLGSAQYKAGRVAEGTRTFGEALESLG